MVSMTAAPNGPEIDPIPIQSNQSPTVNTTVLNQPPITPTPTTATGTAKQRNLLTEFILGGTATMSACLFTNPIEVVKTRMQLFGELANKTTTAATATAATAASNNPYSSASRAFITIARNEGLSGLQGGLMPAMLYQLTMNGTRLGLYGPLKRLLSAESTVDNSNLLLQMFAGSSSGIISAAIGSPFFMMKVRLQVQNSRSAVTAPAPAPAAPAAPAPVTAIGAARTATTIVGHQHHYTGTISGLYEIFCNEGIRGLYRGASAAMVRVGIGSGVQLGTYDYCKRLVINNTGLMDGIVVHLLSSLISGLFVTVAMNPADVLTTRMYNQPINKLTNRGLLYNSLSDCAIKTVRTEGLLSLYKGFIPHYLRLGPHTILTFIFWEQAKLIAQRMGY